MKSGITKKIVVIKDIQSNMIEEAILILKGGPEGNVGAGGRPVQTQGIADDSLIKEAEMVISNYIKESRLPSAFEKAGRASLPAGKRRLLANMLINAVLIGSIAILIFLIVKITQTTM